MGPRSQSWAALAAALLLVPLAVPLAGQARAQEPDPRSLFELLDLVEQGLEVESEANRARERAFVAAKAEQERLLAEAKARLAEKEALSQRLELTYNENESALGEAEGRLTERLGEMGEIFGVVRQIATDLSGQVWESITSSQLPPRAELLERLGRSKELPTTQDLERLWFELQREMTEQGQVVRYDAPVLTLAGSVEEKEVIRAGPFAAIADGRYLLWESGEEKLRELGRQPPSRYVETVAAFEATEQDFAPLAVDPSRGSLLNALTDTPSFQERIGQGGYVGMVILSLGAVALLIGVVRWLMIFITGRRVSAQLKRDGADEGNPLGRVLSVYERNRTAEPETLELRLDEQVMRESARIERLLWVVKTISVVAPLLGLLGTVTGMIQTFQAITLFGAGDPKMMAGGISEALVTTMLGLVVAIPLVLLFDTLDNSAKRIIDVLDEQTAGIIADRAEASRDAD